MSSRWSGGGRWRYSPCDAEPVPGPDGPSPIAAQKVKRMSNPGRVRNRTVLAVLGFGPRICVISISHDHRRRSERIRELLIGFYHRTYILKAQSTDRRSVGDMKRKESNASIRNVRKPEERLQEFLDTAESLFIEKGYDSTTVTDIITRMGLAKGAFYHYFTSKEEVVGAIVERIATRAEEALVDVSGRDELNGPEKLIAVIEWVIRFRAQNEIFNFIHDSRNALIHHRITSEYVPRFIPPLISIVEQGIHEGVFNTDYPEESAMGLLLVWNISEESLLHPKSPENLHYKILATQDLMEKILGANPGTLDGFEALWGEEYKSGK